MARIIIVWGLWGPYHRRRFEAFRDYAACEGHQVTGVSLFSGSRAYQWSSADLPAGVVHFDLGNDETRFPLRNISSLLSIPWRLRPDVALLPSYDHWSLALNAATRTAGGRLVMMNDTHAGTARARGLKAVFKQRVVAGFDSALVAGAPQRRYFASLGLPPEKIFTGYDVVDNDYFAGRSEAIRSRQLEVRRPYDLPEHYFLSLGRFVEKKNLAVLIQAYQKFLVSSADCRTHLVIVGAGEEEANLLKLCGELQLRVYDKKTAGPENQKSEAGEPPGVHFYGFRQIEENPVFYALADAFVLPSLWEEWGLVVNEAMACGLPVIVSETAGCVEDLMNPGQPVSLHQLVGERFRQWPLMHRFIRQNGFAFDPRSPESLAMAMGILASSQPLRAVMGRAGREIVGHYSCGTFARNALLAAQAARGGCKAAGQPLPEARPLVENSKLIS